MPDFLTRLSTALADRYTIVRELGAGGMAIVYLADDLKHHRQVALKVLRPELAAVLGPDRFLREIEIAAKLSHPNILPLFDSGGSDFLYYVMPFVEGNSLRDRIDREQQLPIDAALKIAEQVGSALEYAHSRDVIHRDIKPENVMLHQGVAMVTDFGIALALGQISNARLTETGLSIGTPAYMSPEQASGEQSLDGRSDVYSLGVVVFEMLTGETPYTGPTAQSIIAKQIVDPVPSARRLRATVPEQVDTTLQRALAKSPADRFASIGEFVRHLVADAHTPPQKKEGGFPIVGGRMSRAVVTGIAIALVVFAIWYLSLRASGAPDADVDPSVLAVFPFEVRGTEEFAYLREGMVDLVSTKLDGVGGLRVVDPYTTVALMSESSKGSTPEREARQAGAMLGAGWILRGSVVQVEGSLQLRSSVYGPADGDRIDASVTGDVDQLFGLVDEMVGQLVSGGLIMEESPLSSLEGLTTSSNEALRLYLTGMQAFRTGRGTQETFGRLTRAVGLDSTFALASYWAGYAAAYDEIEDPEPHFQLALRHQDRLGPRDRMRLSAALAGSQGRHADALRLYESFVGRYADDLAGWFQLAEQRAHTGHYLGRTLSEARPAYERAVLMDPALAPAYYHLTHIGGLQGDTAALRAWAIRLDSLHVDGLWIALAEFMGAVVGGDSLAARTPFDRVRAEESNIPAATLAGSVGELMGATIEHAPHLSRKFMSEFSTRAFTDTARTVGSRRVARIESALGRFDAAEQAIMKASAALQTALAQDLAWIALHPATNSSERIERAVRALDGVRPPPGSGEAAARHYLLARLALRLMREDSFETHRYALTEFQPGTVEIGRFASDLALELNAVAARANGEPSHALEALLQATYWEQSQPWLGFPQPTYLDGRLADGFPMFLRAELLNESGQDSLAAQWYRVAADGVWHRGPALLGLAEVRSRQGAGEEAADLYRRVQALWEDAEPDVTSFLERAEQRLETARE